MRRTVALLFIILSAGLSASPLVPGTNTDGEIAAMLVGTWFSSDSDIYFEKTFQPGGTASGFILVLGDDGNVTARADFISKWAVQNGCLIGEVLQSTEHHIVGVGTTFSDQITSVSEERFQFLDHGVPTERLRKQANAEPETR